MTAPVPLEIPHVAVRPRHVLSLFAGGGGLDLALREAVPAARTVCLVEHEAFAAAVLVARMAEGALAPAPVWSDARTFDGRRWRGHVDTVVGGTPCQDLSVAGQREGITGDRSGLWGEFRRIVSECEPCFVFWENVGAATSAAGNVRDPDDGAADVAASRDVPAGDGIRPDVEDAASESVRALGVVLGDLAALGFDAEWGLFRASDAGAPHRRERLFVLGWHPGRLVEVGHERGCADESVAGARSGPLAHADGTGRSARSGGRIRRDVRRVSEPAASRLSTVPFPPGPGDAAGWREYLARFPDLAPAIPQRALRRGADGLAAGLDVRVRRGEFCECPRIARLRVCGNGVVAAQGALALRELWRRAFGGELT